MGRETCKAFSPAACMQSLSMKCQAARVDEKCDAHMRQQSQGRLAGVHLRLAVSPRAGAAMQP